MRAFGVHGSTTNHGGFVQATQQRSSFNGQLFLRAGDGFFVHVANAGQPY